MPRISLTKERQVAHTKIRDFKSQARRRFCDGARTFECVRGNDYEMIVDLVASLKREREQQGLMQAELAKRLGIDPTAPSRLENSRAENPTIVTLVAPCKPTNEIDSDKFTLLMKANQRSYSSWGKSMRAQPTCIPRVALGLHLMYKPRSSTSISFSLPKSSDKINTVTRSQRNAPRQTEQFPMITDPIFYRLFATSPETFFLLLGMPVDAARDMAARYQYEALEFKETSHRLDGVFQPKESGLPLYFLEVQFYSLPSVFADLLVKAYTYLKRHDPTQTFYGIVLFAERGLEPKELAPYQALLDAGVIRRYYLDEMPEFTDAPLGLSILNLIRKAENEAPATAASWSHVPGRKLMMKR